jgi:hypothetical protein
MLLKYCLGDTVVVVVVVIIIIITTIMIKSSRIRWEGYVEWPERNAYRISAGKPEINRPLEKPIHRWIHLAQDRYNRMLGLL